MVKIKERIIKKIYEIKDQDLLEELLKAVELEHEIDGIYELSREEKDAIDEGIDDAEAGNTHSSEEASELVRKWLRK